MKLLTKILKKEKLYFCFLHNSVHWAFPTYEDAEKLNYNKISDLDIAFYDGSLLGKGEHFIFLKKENECWVFLYKDKVLTTSGIKGFHFYEIS